MDFEMSWRDVDLEFMMQGFVVARQAEMVSEGRTGREKLKIGKVLQAVETEGQDIKADMLYNITV
jgi:hypothetical protein